jgi:protein phosphatase
MEFGAASDVGLHRSNNEDHYAVVRRSRARQILLTNVDVAGLTIPDDEAFAMIVADGMGGCGFGELASELVLRIGWELAGEAPMWVMKFNPAVLPRIREKLQNYGRQIQDELRDYAAIEPGLTGMGTTWTCAYLMGRDAIIAHVGDSRAYLFRAGSLRQMTRDHTFAQQLKDQGVPPAETEPYKHLLVNTFGAHPGDVAIDIDHLPLEDDDRILLCSDGLTDMVSDGDITATLASVAGAQAACDALIACALKNGGRDNVTAVVADVHPAAAPPQMP